MKAIICIVCIFCVFLFCVPVIPRLSYAYECGRTESADLRIFIEQIISESNKLEKCIKSNVSSDKEKASCRLLQATLHSLYISAQAMRDMIHIGCNIVKCSRLDKALLVNVFEGHDAMISGIGFSLDGLRIQFKMEGQSDLANVCYSMRRRIDDVTLKCNKFYGTIFERMGEKPPPSP